jgi:hypothetical protein
VEPLPLDAYRYRKAGSGCCAPPCANIVDVSWRRVIARRDEDVAFSVRTHVRWRLGKLKSLHECSLRIGKNKYLRMAANELLRCVEQLAGDRFLGVRGGCVALRHRARRADWRLRSAAPCENCYGYAACERAAAQTGNPQYVASRCLNGLAAVMIRRSRSAASMLDENTASLLRSRAEGHRREGYSKLALRGMLSCNASRSKSLSPHAMRPRKRAGTGYLRATLTVTPSGYCNPLATMFTGFPPVG